MSANVIPFKQDLPKELELVATTFTDEAQNAALRKANELGFDTAKGIISLEETLINLSSARDLLLDVVRKGRLTQLPLKLQYALLDQARRTAQSLTALSNGTDAVVNLVNSVEDLTASIWQFNLPNLSGEVLGFQSKMNQLKAVETRIRQVSREAEDFVLLHDSAKKIHGQMSDISTAAAAQKASIQASTEEVESVLQKTNENAQKVASLAAQVQQYETTAAQQLANSKQAAADTEAISNKSKEVQSEIESTRSALQGLTHDAQELLSKTQASAASQLSDFMEKYDEVVSSTGTATSAMLEKVESTLSNQAKALTTRVDSATDDLQSSKKELETRVTQLTNDTGSRLVQAEGAHELRLAEQLKGFVTTSQSQLTAQSEEFQKELSGFSQTAKSSLETGDEERKKLVANLAELEGRIRESIERATGYTLFHSFQKRQLDIAKSKRFWGYALGGLVFISLCASGVFIWSLRYVQAYNAAFYLKLSISVPLIYGIAFCNVQYSRERRLEEEYAFKSNISISLEPYQKLVEKLVDKERPEELAKYTGFVIDSVNRVFTSPTGQIFETPGDKNSAEKVIKACGDLVEPIIKGLKK